MTYSASCNREERSRPSGRSGRASEGTTANERDRAAASGSRASERWGFSERYTAGVSRGIYKIYAGFRIQISVIDHQSTSAETDMNVAEDDDTGKHACIPSNFLFLHYNYVHGENLFENVKQM